MSNQEFNFNVSVKGMQQHITHYNRIVKFSTYDAAVTYFQEMCEMILDFVPEICHNPSIAVELSEGGLGFDYIIELQFENI